MELPEIIGFIILLFSVTVILLFTFSYVIYKLKNPIQLQPGFSKVRGISSKSEQIKVKDLEKDQFSEPVFRSVDDRVQFSQPKVSNRFEIVNENLQLRQSNGRVQL